MCTLTAAPDKRSGIRPGSSPAHEVDGIVRPSGRGPADADPVRHQERVAACPRAVRQVRA